MSSRVSMLENNMPLLHKERSELLINFENDLEFMVIPHLIETIENHNYRSFRFYSTILSSIGKDKEIKNQYLMSRLDTVREICAHFSHSTHSGAEETTRVGDDEDAQASIGRIRGYKGLSPPPPLSRATAHEVVWQGSRVPPLPCSNEGTVHSKPQHMVCSRPLEPTSPKMVIFCCFCLLLTVKRAKMVTADGFPPSPYGPPLC